MKRLIRIIVVLVAAVLASCGGSGSTDATATNPLDQGLAAYERARDLLAHDRTDGLAEAANTAAGAFEAGASAASGATADHLAAASRAARELERVDDLIAARPVFGELSRHVVALAASDPKLTSQLHRFSCPMAPGFGEWVQPTSDISNPYMGTSMPTCGAQETWEQVEEHDHDGDDIAYWTCSMHPSVKEADPGTCPICSMDLTPVTHEELNSGAVIVDSLRRQRYGVRTATVARRALVREVRATGSVRWDESRLADVTVRAEAWVERVNVSAPGALVRRGEALAVLYSPALYAAERELLASRGTGLEASARERLRLFGLGSRQIEAVLASGVANDTTELLAPMSGVVVDKHVVQGAHLMPGSPLYRLADRDRVWVEAEVYEDDLVLVRPGSEVTLTLTSSDPLVGVIDMVEPWIDPTTRRATVRSVVDNPTGELVPGMYVEMALRVELGEGLTVPAEAVVYTGRRRIVFVDEGDDRLVPRDVSLGRRAGDWFEVTDGLGAGDEVVVSGNFVVAAESRIRAAETYWGGDHEGG